jgi:hypothetical protein
MTIQTRAVGINRPDPMHSATTDRRAPMRDLAQALKAGDLTGAAAAYATLASKAPERITNNPDGPFARIGTAIAAGDIAGARAAFADVFRSHLPGHTGEDTPSAPVLPKTTIPGNVGGLLDVSA